MFAVNKFGDGISWETHMDEILGDVERANKLEHKKTPTGDVIGILCKYTGGKDLLDCGCHLSRWGSLFEANGFQYTGIDQSEKVVAKCRELYKDKKLTFLHSFLWDMTFKEQFDICFFNAVLQHNLHVEKRKIFPRVHDALRPNGVLMITESTVTIETITQLTHQGWIDMVQSFGFKLLETSHKNPEGVEDRYVFRKIDKP